MYRYFIEKFTSNTSCVLERNSGTGAVAALMSGRRVIAVEKDPQTFASMVGRVSSIVEDMKSGIYKSPVISEPVPLKNTTYNNAPQYDELYQKHHMQTGEFELSQSHQT